MVNFEKSEVSFSWNVGEAVRENILNNLCVSSVPNHSKYLGLPVLFGRSTKEDFTMVVGRVWKKVKGWKGRNS